MTQTATVESAGPDGYAQVRVKLRSACGHSCEDCGGGCAEARVLRVRAKNPLEAQTGETVTIESATGGVLGAAALVYLLPLAALLAGYLLAAACGAGEALAAAAAALSLLAGGALVVIFNRYIRKDRPLEYTIVAKGPCSDT